MTFTHILVPVDFGEATQPALDLARSVAQLTGARITLVHAFDPSAFMNISPFAPPPDIAPVMDALERELKTIGERLTVDGAKVDSIVLMGNVHETVLVVARANDCNLIVIGTHGRRGIAHALLGSVAEKIVQLSPIPVLTVRPTEARAKSAAAGRDGAENRTSP